MSREEVLEKIVGDIGVTKVEVEQRGLKKLEEVMELLGDGEVCTIEEIATKTGLSDEIVIEMVDFLDKFGFIDKNGPLARITESGLGFLQLPSEN